MRMAVLWQKDGIDTKVVISDLRSTETMLGRDTLVRSTVLLETIVLRHHQWMLKEISLATHFGRLVGRHI